MVGTSPPSRHRSAPLASNLVGFTIEGMTSTSPTTGRPLVQARELTRIWGTGPAAQVGIEHVDLDIGRGELVAIVGRSGSGKSTLGALLSGIDRPTSGTLTFDGRDSSGLSEDDLASWRGRHVGIVFQHFHLLPTLTAVENVELGLDLAGSPRRGRRRRAGEALEALGLGDKRRRLPSELSGGEQQRVGIARAIASGPSLLVADEPTGALDEEAGRQVFDIIAGLASNGMTTVVITHDLALAAEADRIIRMTDGHLDAGNVGRTASLAVAR